MELGNSFRVRDARVAGMGRGALRSVHLAAPFHGVRSFADPADIHERAHAYAVKMRADAVFTGVTAARLWGVPLPAGIPSDRLDVTTPHNSPRALGRGVNGTQHAPGSVDAVEVGGLRMLTPASTWVALGRVLSMPDLVAAGDYLVTPGFRDPRPALCDPEELRRTLTLCRRLGAAGLREALRLVRVGPLSRPESLSRVLFATAGLPSALPNLRVSPLLMFDLAWPEWRVGFDYHGEHHRSAGQHARDVGRLDLARQEGWALVQATKNDLFAHPFDLIGRIRSRLIERGCVVRPVHPSKVARLKP
jgi:hypothetical protein